MPTKSTKPTATAEEAPAPLSPGVPAPGSNLDGAVLRVGAYKKPDCYRPYVHVTDDGVRFTKMVPAGRSATREEALAKAEAYRAQIIAADRLPVRTRRFGWQAGEVTWTHADGSPIED